MEGQGDEIGGRCGHMDVDWLEEKISELGFSLNKECVEDIMNMLNSLGSLYGMKNDDVVDSLSALLMNQKKNVVTLALAQDFEISLQSKNKQKVVLPSAHNIIQRSVLKDITLPASKFDDTYDFGTGYGDDGDDDQTGKPGAGGRVKQTYTGSSFSPLTEDPALDSSQILPPFNVLSECDFSTFSYGDNMAFNLNQIFDDDENQRTNTLEEDQKEVGMAISLSGNLFATDGAPMDFANAGLYTDSRVIPLDFEKMDRVAIFPGKHMKVNGVYNENREFVVSGIVEPVGLPIARLNKTPGSSRIKMVVACGPFSVKEDDISLKKLIDAVVRFNANALLLVGPFLKDDFVTTAAQGTGEIFLDYMRTISELVSRLQLRVFIVPSHEDVNALPFFPTPPYDIPESMLSENVVLLGDPAIFEFGGVQFVASAAETIMHLSRKEVYKYEDMENVNEDRMARLVSHCFASRSLYPIYPGDQSMPLVLKRIKEKTALREKPHVLILPSLLQPTVRIVEDAIYLNPGRFIRGKSGGTYASLEVDVDSAEEDSIAKCYEVVINATL